MRHRVYAAFLALAALSCSPRHFPPVLSDYNRESRVDSVYVLDSVYIDRFRTIQAKADTVYVTDIRTEYKYRYRDRVKTDTLVTVQTVTEVREVERELTKWQVFWIQLGKIAFGAIILAICSIIWKIRKVICP